MKFGQYFSVDMTSFYRTRSQILASKIHQI